ncbi:multicopper oxidase domain-containing protein [Flavobacterium terrae]|uniref:Multicopper oxidase n=1 Tax=Flavobacterium terrae TaxID=415425 RepID=A0A1M6EG66_9FLAO|nr:multicopper oxidase domain-containing protein [Flavobacterium terrae]SHI84320.1 Multicopper oxidase [Flavobacterium terrae]
MKNKLNKVVFLFLLLWSIVLFSQNEQLIIGRTTGTLSINNKKSIRTFGFVKSLSGQVKLPGCTINGKVGDSIHLDFWNISQGNPVSLHCKEIDFVQKDINQEVVLKNEPIHHMEHGYYSFIAKKPGTYLYYSPENYPFNLQAGMFGIMIIKPQSIDLQFKKTIDELLWCSHEIDTKWHTDSLMGTDYNPSNKPISIPDYLPDIFCVNGENINNLKGLQSKKNKEKTILLRLVNAGLYIHVINFPAKVKLEVNNDIGSIYKIKIKDNIVSLATGETIELLVNLEDVTAKERMIYQFIEPKTKKPAFKTTIPILYN